MKSIKKGLIILVGLISLFIFTNRLNASSGYISVTSSRTSMVVGNVFYVDVTLSSSTPLGSLEYTISYDSSKVRLESGQSTVMWYTPNSSTYSQTFSYTFKTIAAGSSNVSVKSYGAYAYDESLMSLSAGSVTVSAITQAQLEASYSKNNNLSDISVSEGSLSPAFNKDTLEYSVVVGSNVEKITIGASCEDRYASVNGTGEHAVSEGDNKFELKVTAENGSAKTYTVTVKVEDKNPIKKEYNGKEYTVVKRASSITVPDTYTLTVIKIGEVEVPSLYSEVTKMTLLALKNDKGETLLFVYDKDSGKISPYNEIKTGSFKLYVTEAKSVPEGYKKIDLKIGDYTVVAYESKEYKTIIINALDIESNTSGLYVYDKDNNSVIKYNDTYDKKMVELAKTNKNFLYIIIGIGAEALLMTILVIVLSIKKNNLKKKILSFEETIKSKKKKKEEVKAEE